MRDCLKEKCSKCCEFMLLELKDAATEDYQKWFYSHLADWPGLFSFLKIEGRDFLRINLKCQFLSECGGCELYNDLLWPQMCKDFHCEDPKYSHVKHLLQ